MQMHVETIEVSGKKYYYTPPTQRDIVGDVKLVILQRGWCMVGRLERNGSECKLHNASVIRTWGTTKGLGEIANGPTSSTKLDKCYGVVEFDWLTVVAAISADEEKWKNYL